MPNQVTRELAITVPLLDDKGRRGDGRPQVDRFRGHWLQLGQCRLAFRPRYSLTQAEFARAVGAEGYATLAQWESGMNVPDGIGRERLLDVIEGRRRQKLRAAVIDGDGMPRRWNEGARWYRRPARERRQRERVGTAVAGDS